MAFQTLHSMCKAAVMCFISTLSVTRTSHLTTRQGGCGYAVAETPCVSPIAGLEGTHMHWKTMLPMGSAQCALHRNKSTHRQQKVLIDDQARMHQHLLLDGRHVREQRRAQHKQAVSLRIQPN